MGRLTNSIPKPLIKVGKMPIIEHKLRYYKNQGLNNFILSRLQVRTVKIVFTKKFSYTFSNAGINAGILKRIVKVKKFINDHTIISYGDTLQNKL